MRCIKNLMSITSHLVELQKVVRDRIRNGWFRLCPNKRNTLPAPLTWGRGEASPWALPRGLLSCVLKNVIYFHSVCVFTKAVVPYSERWVWDRGWLSSASRQHSPGQLMLINSLSTLLPMLLQEPFPVFWSCSPCNKSCLPRVLSSLFLYLAIKI